MCVKISKIIGFLVFAWLAPLRSEDITESVVLSQGFEDQDYFKNINNNGLVGDENTSSGRWGIYLPGSGEISDEQAAVGNYSMKVLRGGVAGAGFFNKGIPAEQDFNAELWFFRQPSGGSGIMLYDYAVENTAIAGVSIAGNGAASTMDYATGKWIPSKVVIPAGTWVQINIFGRRADNTYRATVTLNGKMEEVGVQKMAKPLGVTKIQFYPYVSEKGIACYFDEIKIEIKKETTQSAPAGSIAAPVPINDRNNIAQKLYGTRAVLVQKSGEKTNDARVIDGSHEDGSCVTLKGMPGSVVLYFPAPVQISTVRIFPGMTIYAPNPSGDCGVKDYVIEGENNSAWLPLGEAKDQPDFLHSGASSNAAYFFQHDFKPTTVNAVRLTVTRSGFTGRTMSSPNVVPEVDRHCFIREIEVYEARKSSSRLVGLTMLLGGDFRLPVYRGQNEAVLLLKGDSYLKPAPAKLEVKDEASSKLMEPSRTIQLKSGEWKETFAIASWPTGRYLVTIKAADENSPVKGEFSRLIRIDRPLTVPPPAEPVDVAGRKIYPIDDFEIAVRQGVTTSVNPVDEVIQATKPLAPGRNQQMAREGMGFDPQGNLIIPFWDASNSGVDRRNHYAWSKDLKNWTVADTLPPEVSRTRGKSPYEPLPDPARPKWGPKTPMAKATIRFYNAAKDGVPPLNEIFVPMFTKGARPDLKALGIVDWSCYPVWEKSGQWLVLTAEPITIVKFQYDQDELDKEIDANDNFGGQYLSDDGKTLHYIMGRRIRRFTPFNVEYDNINQANRILMIYSTTDGFHWQRLYFTLPEESDHWSYQHYGAYVFRVQKHFYLAYLHAYDCRKQQIYSELNYSRDGLNFKRFNGQPPFVANGPIGTWTSGMNFIEAAPVERDGKYYLLLGTTRRHMHFYNIGQDDLSFVTGDYLERSFGGRKLAEEWPYFKEVGGWKGLANEWKNANSCVGIAIFRKDGWLSADAEKGTLVTRCLDSKGGPLSINAKGGVKIEVLSATGADLREYCGDNAAKFSGDAVSTWLSWKNGAIKNLPASPFKLRITLTKAKLYTLNFQSDVASVTPAAPDADKKSVEKKTGTTDKAQLLCQGFEDEKYFADVSGNGYAGDIKTTGGRWAVLNPLTGSEISTEQAFAGKYSLKVIRGHEAAAGFIEEGVPVDGDFVVEVRMYRQPGAGCSIVLKDAERAELSAVSASDTGVLLLKDILAQKHIASTVKLPENTWGLITIFGKRADNTFRAVLTVNGKAQEIGVQKMPKPSDISTIQFFPWVSEKGKSCYFDEIKINTIK